MLQEGLRCARKAGQTRNASIACLRLLCLLLALSLAAPALAGDAGERAYGVFLSLDQRHTAQLAGYDELVIDAQYFDAQAIARLKAGGAQVYSYLNIGSVEDFRPYYQAYRPLFLGAYEGWPEEQWVNVADQGWQRFILGELAADMVKKGVDGFFVDNCDVYAVAPEQAILDGLAVLLRGLRQTGLQVIVNGGKGFADAWRLTGGSLTELITGINQEEVFTAIDFESGQLLPATAEDSAAYRHYVEQAAREGIQIYLLEYTRDPSLVAQAQAYCRKQGFRLYVSDSIELDGYDAVDRSPEP